MGAPYDAVFFDLDGTLLDTAGHIVESLRYALETHLDYSPSDAVLVSGIGTPLYEQMVTHGSAGLGHDAPAATVQKLHDTYIEHNRSTHDERVAAFAHVPATVQALHEQGVILAIVTSKPNGFARRGLRITGLESYFPLVIGFDDVAIPKPDPTPVRDALSFFELAPEQALFIGDSPHDIHAGNGAGVATGAAGWGPFDPVVLRASKPTYWFDDIRAILELVR